MDEAPSPQLICEFCIIPELAVTVAVTVLPAVIAVGETARDVSRNTDEYVHDNPWKSIAIVAVAALLLGLIFGGRRD